MACSIHCARNYANSKSVPDALSELAMAQDEFSIIDRYFARVGKTGANSLLGIGDDAAVVSVPSGYQLVVSMDTLVSGVHFAADTSAADIAYKSLAVNLSDLAAMAATPSWFLLSLTLPQIDQDWLSQFSNELKQTADGFNLQLIGGDTCRGPLAISIQIAGLVPDDSYVSRAGARVGDLVLVSGELGNAALGLAYRQAVLDLPRSLRAKCELALNRPRPRLELTAFLREFASAAIDISDGLQADLGHLLDASHCGASILRQRLPVDDWIRRNDAWHYALGAGDDYEICCCIAAADKNEIEDWNQAHPDCRLSLIGEITEAGYSLHDGQDLIDLANSPGYRHFD